ncbi:MAG TPA: hypothetical protein VMS75_03225 [Terriglobales bacterium]|nr:hypothetical protein [Terriglobales bacterium]
MIRRTWVRVLLAVLAVGLAAAADWKSEFLSLLGPRPDYAKAREYLAGKVGGLEGADRQVAEALLPYLAGKAGAAAEERELLAAYFDKYGDADPEFGFLDEGTLRDFMTFWARWKKAFPLVTDVSFLVRTGAAASGLPAGLEVGLELMCDAFYKVSLGPFSLEGGFWSRGFHILTLPAAGLFERSGTYEFDLDLKAGDLVVRKPIRVAVDLVPAAALRPAAPVLPPAAAAPNRTSPPVTNLEGELSLYVDGKLVMTTRKVAVKPKPLGFKLPGPSMPGQKPYLPPPRTDPMANSISILDAISATYKALKDLLSKKPAPAAPPAYAKSGSLSLTFTRAEAGGTSSNVRAEVRLERTRTSFLRQ